MRAAGDRRIPARARRAPAPTRRGAGRACPAEAVRLGSDADSSWPTSPAPDQSTRGVQMNVPAESVFFDPRTAELTSEAPGILNNVRARLHGREDTAVLVTGDVDPIEAAAGTIGQG